MFPLVLLMERNGKDSDNSNNSNISDKDIDNTGGKDNNSNIKVT